MGDLRLFAEAPTTTSSNTPSSGPSPFCQSPWARSSIFPTARSSTPTQIFGPIEKALLGKRLDPGFKNKFVPKNEQVHSPHIAPDLAGRHNLSRATNFRQAFQVESVHPCRSVQYGRTGRSEKAALGDHSPAGYRQRARFYSISDEGRLRFAQNVAKYILFLAEPTGLAPAETCEAARTELAAYPTFADFLAGIAST